MDFAAVYIVEAHAQDEWPIGDPLKISQPRSDAERCGIARQFQLDYNLQIPLLVDTVQNCFEETYAAWPIRFYVVTSTSQDGPTKGGPTVIYKAQPDHNNTYDSIIPHVRVVLHDLLAR